MERARIGASGLARLYWKQGKYAEAEPLFQRDWHIREQQLGEEHLLVAETLHDLARFWEMQGHRPEALVIREQALGTVHPKTTQTRTCLITLLHAMGQQEQAATLEAVQPGTAKSAHEQTRAKAP